MRAQHAVQLAKETFVDETETGLWSAHAQHEPSGSELRIRVPRFHARPEQLRLRLLLPAEVLRENVLCRRTHMRLQLLLQ